MAKGIDVYTAYQTVTDWNAVRRAGYEFAYVKVSDGNTNRGDGGYGPAGRAAGLAMGGYHYAQPGDPVAQANRLVDRAAAAGLLDLAPTLDLEAPFVPGQLATSFAVAFLRQVKARGHRACLYANNSMLANILPAVKAAVPDVLVWVARYGATPTVPYDVWQHSSSGRVPGIQAQSVDLNTGTVPLNNQAQEADMAWQESDFNTPLFTDNPGTPQKRVLRFRDVMGEMRETLKRLDAGQAGLLAAVQAATKDPAITEDKLRQIVNDAVAQHVQITGTVEITSKDGAQS